MSNRSEILQCEWTGWLAVGQQELRLDLPFGNCCDMSGAVEGAEYLMPEVRKISVYVCGQPDIEYRKIGGKWEAFGMHGTTKP